MRKLKHAAVVATAGLALALGATGTAQASTPTEYEFAGAYDTEAQCLAAGDQGVGDGTYARYRCLLFEARWDLYAVFTNGG
ncbi:hypothetical protein AB0M28_01520 [Streptomyces sp. NPDC051940]|uniref:hypothetical protein n=1 Tax=Streptomyces sp. NPDC051940 TaxID=3155675 RepID=UPI00342A1F2E